MTSMYIYLHLQNCHLDLQFISFSKTSETCLISDSLSIGLSSVLQSNSVGGSISVA